MTYKLNGEISRMKLEPVKGADHHKSYYGKAWVVICEDGIWLQSYNTVVCGFDNKRYFHRLWHGYSATTMRHINSFMAYMGYWDCRGKTWWDAVGYDPVLLSPCARDDYASRFNNRLNPKNTNKR